MNVLDAENIYNSSNNVINFVNSTVQLNISESSENQSVNNLTENLTHQLHDSQPVSTSWQHAEIGASYFIDWMPEVSLLGLFNSHCVIETCKNMKNTVVRYSILSYQYLKDCGKEICYKVSKCSLNICLTSQMLLEKALRFGRAILELTTVVFDAWCECMFGSSDEKMTLAADVLESYLLSFQEEKQKLEIMVNDYKDSFFSFVNHFFNMVSTANLEKRFEEMDTSLNEIQTQIKINFDNWYEKIFDYSYTKMILAKDSFGNIALTISESWKEMTQRLKETVNDLQEQIQQYSNGDFQLCVTRVLRMITELKATWKNKVAYLKIVFNTWYEKIVEYVNDDYNLALMDDMKKLISTLDISWKDLAIVFLCCLLCYHNQQNTNKQIHLVKDKYGIAIGRLQKDILVKNKQLDILMRAYEELKLHNINSNQNMFRELREVEKVMISTLEEM